MLEHEWRIAHKTAARMLLQRKLVPLPGGAQPAPFQRGQKRAAVLKGVVTPALEASDLRVGSIGHQRSKIPHDHRPSTQPGSLEDRLGARHGHEPIARRFDTELGEFVLPSTAGSTAHDPDAVLLEFLQRTTRPQPKPRAGRCKRHLRRAIERPRLLDVYWSKTSGTALVGRPPRGPLAGCPPSSRSPKALPRQRGPSSLGVVGHRACQRRSSTLVGDVGRAARRRRRVSHDDP